MSVDRVTWRLMKHWHFPFLLKKLKFLANQRSRFAQDSHLLHYNFRIELDRGKRNKKMLLWMLLLIIIHIRVLSVMQLRERPSAVLSVITSSFCYPLQLSWQLDACISSTQLILYSSNLLSLHYTHQPSPCIAATSLWLFSLPAPLPFPFP